MKQWQVYWLRGVVLLLLVVGFLIAVSWFITHLHPWGIRAFGLMVGVLIIGGISYYITGGE